MKRLVLAAIAVVAFSATSFAQQQVKFGPKAGVNFATISGDDAADMLTSFHVGAVAEIKFSDRFSVQPELVYSMQGAKTAGTVMMTTYEGKQKLDYINIPVMAKYYVAEGFSIEAGPQVGFLMKAEAEVDTTTGSATTNTKTDNKDNYKGVDFGVNFGLAYDLPQGLFFNARYNLGLSKIGEDVTVGSATFEAEDFKNAVIQVSVGYKF